MCLEIVRAMTYVINQGLALYWGTSRWGAAEIMVSVPATSPVPQLVPSFHMTAPNPTLLEAGGSGRKWKPSSDPRLFCTPTQEAYSMARQFNLIPPVCEQAEHHLFQREKVETQLPELYHKIGSKSPHPYFSLGLPIA